MAGPMSAGGLFIHSSSLCCQSYSAVRAHPSFQVDPHTPSPYGRHKHMANHFIFISISLCAPVLSSDLSIQLSCNPRTH